MEHTGAHVTTRILVLFALLVSATITDAACLINQTEKDPLVFIIDCTLDRTQCTTVKKVAAYEKLCYEGVGFAQLKQGKGTKCSRVRMSTNDTGVFIKYDKNGKLTCKAKRKIMSDEILTYIDKGRKEWRQQLSEDDLMPKLRKSQKLVKVYYYHPDREYKPWKVEIYGDKGQKFVGRFRPLPSGVGLAMIAAKKDENYLFKIIHETGHIDVDLDREVNDKNEVWVLFDNGPTYTNKEEAVVAIESLYGKKL